MALAGRLEIEMVAGIARLQSDMNQAKSVVGSTMKSIEGAVASAKNALGALGIGLGVGYFVSLIKGSIDAMDHLNDLSKTTSIAVDQLSGLGLAARQSGGDLDSIAQSINKLSQNMGKDAEKFAALGVSAKDPLQAFKQLSDIFVQIQDPQQRAAVAAAALGKAWAGAAPLLSEGSAKIQEMVDRGMVLSGVNKENARQADEFKDRLAELETVMGRARNQMVGAMLPAFTDITKAIMEAYEASGKLQAAWVALGSLGAFLFTDEFSSNTVKLANLQKQLAGLREEAEFAKTPSPFERMFGLNDLPKINAEIEKTVQKIAQLTAEMNKAPKPAAGVDSALAAAAAARAAEFLKESKAVKEVESPYLNLIKALEQKLLIDKETTEVDKLLFELDRMRGDQYAQLTIAQLANLEATAHLIDLKNKDAAVTKSLLDYDEETLKLKKEYDAAVSEEQNKIGQAILAASKQIEQMELETSLIGKTNVERETAIFLRQAEIDKIDEATIARMKEAIAAKHAAEEAKSAQVSFWQSVESAGHQAFLSIFDTSKSVLERIRDMLKTHIIDILYQITVKKWIVQIVASTSGAGVAQSAFGSTGSMGGIGSLFSGLGSFASGISSAASAADWGSIAGAAAGATGIVDSVFQTMGVKLGSQFLADIGNFNWGVPVISGVIQALSGNVAGGIGSTIGGIAGSYFGPIGTVVGSFIGSFIGDLLGGGGGETAVGTGYRASGTATGGRFSGTVYGLSTAGMDPLADQAGHAAGINQRLASIVPQMEQIAARLGYASNVFADQAFAVDVSSGMDYAKVLDAAAASVAQQMVLFLIPNIKDYQKANETLDVTLGRLIADVDAVKIVFQTLGKTLPPTVDASERLVAVFGGLQNLQSQFQAYYDAFYTDAERLALTQKQLHDSFVMLNLAEPTTRAGFRALVESLDLTTATGALMFKALMDMAPAFDTVAKATEGVTGSVRDMTSAWQDANDSIIDEIQRIRGLTGATPQGLAAAQGQFAISTAQARAGDIEAAKLLPGLSQAVLDLASRTVVTSLDFARIKAQLLGSLELTAGQNAATYGLTMPSYDSGTTYVPRTGPALLHAGERVLTAGSNDELVTEVRALRSEVAAMRRGTDKTATITEAVSQGQLAFNTTLS